jgi:hypothetical protein
MTLFPLTDCCERLSVDPKTLRQWIKHAAMPLQAHPTDARVKCLTLPQVQQLASAHGRSLQSPQPPQSEPSSLTAPALLSAPAPMQTVSPPCPSEADLHQQLAFLQAQIGLLHQQVAALSALVPAPEPQRLCSPTLPQQQGISQAESGPRPHPAESRRRPLLPLIEYGAQDVYLVICPQQGELPLNPESPEWFAWLASLSSFRFVGKCGRFTACRVYDDKGPTRSWQAHRVIHQRHYKPHLGVTECLTIDRLEQAAATLQSYVDSR